MAIVQISKIQQRSGNLVDLPQLDEAELGWATDAKRLFIGKTTPNENIEVLTSYSTIEFSQIDGSVGNLDITGTVANGQVLTYDGNNWVNRGGTEGGLIDLGTVANVKIEGGAIGYVLETDGTGNLAWTPKGTLYTNIIGLSNANPIVMTVPNTTPYTNKQAITISGANGVSNSIVNGQTFYISLASNYPTTGNVSLYSDSTLTTPVNGAGLTYTNSPNAVATAVISSGGGTGTAGGSNTAVQYNNSGIISGDSNLVYDFANRILTLAGNANVSNLNATSSVIASTLTSNIATGTPPLTVTSTTRVSNLSVAYSNVSDFGVTTLQTTGTFFPVFVNGSSTANRALGANANLSFNAATGALSATLITGTLTTAAQPNITSVGTLTTLTVTGNANVGNLGTSGLIVATGNITGGNLVTSGALSVTGNANVGNLGTAGLIVATGNVTGGNLITGGALSVTGNANVGNLGTTGLIIATGNITGGNLLTGGVVTATGNVTGGNLSTGGALSVTGNANVGNIGAAAGVFTTVTGTLTTAAQPNITSVGTLTTLAVTGNVTAGNMYANSGTIGASLLNGTLTTAAQPNITSVGTLTGLGVNGTITGVNVIANTGYIQTTTLTTGANTTAGTMTGNWTLSAGSRLQATYADLAEYYSADQHYAPGTVLEFGGIQEVTLATDSTTRVAGVVSTDPAYAMNANCAGEHPVAIALQGRVPVKVHGIVFKGDMMISGGNGYARPCNSPLMGSVIGKALENFSGTEGVIEIAIGRL